MLGSSLPNYKMVLFFFICQKISYFKEEKMLGSSQVNNKMVLFFDVLKYFILHARALAS